MYKPIALYIGLRYTRAKRDNRFISMISLISMLGIALGVVVLITILSVLNGFDREIKKQIFGMISPITINSYVGKIENWQQLEKSILTTPQVTAVAPLITGQALITNSFTTQPIMLTGILPAEEKRISALPDKIVSGKLNALTQGSNGIVIGKELADRIGVSVGGEVTVATTKGVFSTDQIVTPRFKKFTVVGLFKAGGGGFSFDTKLAFINLYDAQKLFEFDETVSALHVNVNDIYQAPAIARALQSKLSPNEVASDWTQQLGEFFENIRMTKTMMFFIFVLIIAVAVFNLICTMVMVVKNKQADIAILRTLGATPVMILFIFIIQGAAIGLGGTLLGVIGGILLTWNITAISNAIQTIFHVQLVKSSVYFVNYLPSELQWADVGLISLVALILCLLATLYPAWSASQTQPVEALRDE